MELYNNASVKNSQKVTIIIDALGTITKGLGKDL